MQTQQPVQPEEPQKTPLERVQDYEAEQRLAYEAIENQVKADDLMLASVADFSNK